MGWRCLELARAPTRVALALHAAGRSTPFWVMRRSQLPSTRRLAERNPLPRAFSTARLAQSAERKALNLVVVGSSPTVGELFPDSTSNILD